MIRQVDRVILKDIVGPWLFGVGLFSTLLMAATYLGRLAGFIVDGVPPMTVVELVGLLMPAILAQTFSMSVLLATLLGFGRLSSDSEIVALRAAGSSLYRIMAPVAVFSVLVSIVTFGFQETIVPSAAQTAKDIQANLLRNIKVKAAMPIARTIVTDGKLRAFVNAKNVNPANQMLEDVSILVYDDQQKLSFIVFAKEAEYNSDNDRDWKLRGDVRLITPDLSKDMSVPDQVWPTEIPKINQSFSQFTADRDDDFASVSMAQLGELIKLHRKLRDKTPSVLNNYEYGYWNKIAVPLAAVFFGLLGAALGIRNHRTGTAAGFAMAVAIIFGYVTLLNFMNVWAMGGTFPPWVACFTPLVIAGVASGVIMWRRNG